MVPTDSVDQALQAMDIPAVAIATLTTQVSIGSNFLPSFYNVYDQYRASSNNNLFHSCIDAAYRFHTVKGIQPMHYQTLIDRGWRR